MDRRLSPKGNIFDEWALSAPATARPVIYGRNFFRSRGYDETADHIAAFFRGIETREHVVEDEIFGNNAAIACQVWQVTPTFTKTRQSGT